MNLMRKLFSLFFALGYKSKKRYANVIAALLNCCLCYNTQPIVQHERRNDFDGTNNNIALCLCHAYQTCQKIVVLSKISMQATLSEFYPKKLPIMVLHILLLNKCNVKSHLISFPFSFLKKKRNLSRFLKRNEKGK